MFSFTIRSLSPCSLAISSSTGAIILHGPHHSAQKSTRTGLSLSRTSVLKLSSLTGTVLPMWSSFLARPQWSRSDLDAEKVGEASGDRGSRQRTRQLAGGAGRGDALRRSGLRLGCDPPLGVQRGSTAGTGRG